MFWPPFVSRLLPVGRVPFGSSPARPPESATANTSKPGHAPPGGRRDLSILICGILLAASVAPNRDVEAEGPTTIEILPEVAVGVVDTAGNGYLIIRPLVQYQWLTPAAQGKLPQVRRFRSDLVVFEEETTSETRGFLWENLQSIRPVVSADGADRVLVALSDGQSYRCLTGYTQPGRVPSVIGQPNEPPPSQITRMIKAVRPRAGQPVAVELPWASIASMEVFSLAGRSPAAIARMDTLVQERARLHKRIEAINHELSGTSSETRGP